MQPHTPWPAPLDVVGLTLVALALVLGLFRGLWWQVMRLVGVTLSLVAARLLGETLAARVHGQWPDLTARSAYGLAWGTVFVLCLFTCALFGILGQRMLEAMKLDLANRLAGACAGALTGLCVHVALIVLVCQLASPAFLGHYVAGTYSGHVYAAVGLRWPVVQAAEAGREVERALRDAPPRPRPQEQSTSAVR